MVKKRRTHRHRRKKKKLEEEIRLHKTYKNRMGIVKKRLQGKKGEIWNGKLK